LAGALTQTPLGSLQDPHPSYLDLRGPTSNGREEREGEGRVGEGGTYYKWEHRERKGDGGE